jgi:hypothetical protein
MDFTNHVQFGNACSLRLLSTALVGVALFALAVEGLICLIMALPLAVILSLFGGFIGYLLQQRPSVPAQTFRVVTAVFLLMPVLHYLNTAGETPATYAVKTSVIINAKRETVWNHVVSFAQLQPPKERLFQTGMPFRFELRYPDKV